MGYIQILDPHLSNQIAAGEVVERPSSVVKELVENAIDAKATRIQIQIEEGGISLIRVSDNGVGMEKEDAQLSFVRHATSKIKRERDLFSIHTLGFRGEALPSIASVAKITLTTSRDVSELATSIQIEGGEIKNVEDTSRVQGTDICVRDLFYNTPARLKYLKTISTEVAHIVDLIGRIALSNPGISFTLLHDGKELFRSSGDGKLLHVLYALYGRSVSSQMVFFQDANSDFSVHGFLTKPEITRSNRSYLSIILNGRHIRSHPIVHAILRGYGTLLPGERYPLGVIALSMDTKLVDVNVHPAKLEVRISKEKECCGFIETAVKEVLQKNLLIPKVPVFEKKQAQQNTSQESIQWASPKSIPRQEIYDIPKPQPEHWLVNEVNNSPNYVTSEKEKNIETTEVQQASRDNLLPMMLPLAQIHGTYIIAQSQDGFFLIDQHAAHERIYYEQFLEKLGRRNSELQPLLVPLTMETTPAEYEVIGSHVDMLEAWGLHVEPFGGNTVIIRSCPIWFPRHDAESLIHEIFSYLMENGSVDTVKLRDSTAKMMACKAAIKANRRLCAAEMEQLIADLTRCEIPYTCPHGRPIYVQFSTRELEKMFKRVI